MLSGELATYLAGRYVEFVIYPFSFREFMELYHTVYEGADERQRKGSADVGSYISNNSLQHIHITDIVSLDNIFQLYGVEQVPQILTTGFPGGAGL